MDVISQPPTRVHNRREFWAAGAYRFVFGGPRRRPIAAPKEQAHLTVAFAVQGVVPPSPLHRCRDEQSRSCAQR